MSDAWQYEHSFPIAAGVDALFAALTQAEELEQWFAEHASVDARKGGRMEFWGRHTVGTPKEGEAGGLITDFEAGVRLAFEWKLFGVPSTDPATFLGVGALVLTVAAMAGHLPASRATRVDPVRALRAEAGVDSPYSV